MVLGRSWGNLAAGISSDLKGLSAVLGDGRQFRFFLSIVMLCNFGLSGLTIIVSIPVLLIQLLLKARLLLRVVPIVIVPSGLLRVVPLSPFLPYRLLLARLLCLQLPSVTLVVRLNILNFDLFWSLLTRQVRGLGIVLDLILFVVRFGQKPFVKLFEVSGQLNGP